MKQREGRAEGIYIYVCVTLPFYTSEISLKLEIQKFKKMT
jgi:hypothetical protein